MIPFTSVVVLSVAEIETDASSAAILKVDMSEANLCSFVEVCFARIDRLIDGIMVELCLYLLDSFIQNEFTD